jgi:hypothetical protein
MAPETSSTDTGMLQLESLQLDVQTLQRYREEDKQEFIDFSTLVQANFTSIQNNFNNIQANFGKLFAARKADNLDNSPHRQASNHPQTPPNPVDVSATSIKKYTSHN